MSKLIRSFFLLAATASLGACATSGDIINSHVQAGGIGYSPVTGVTAGYLAANHTFVPALTKNSSGVETPLLYAGNCGRQGPPPVTSIQSGNASATATMTGGAGSATSPSLQVAMAINQGLIVGEPAIIEELAALQAANGGKYDAMASYDACPQAVASPGGGAASSTPIP